MTVTPFTPGVNTPFIFQPTLDGVDYTAVITWNVYGQRWYFNLATLRGALVVSRALAGSPDGYDINLVAGYFKTSQVVYREPSNQFEVTP